MPYGSVRNKRIGSLGFLVYWVGQNPILSTPIGNSWSGDVQGSHRVIPFQEQYGSTYGIKEADDGIKMDFVTTTK